MIYFDSKYLSESLQINLAKWKRWTREFLPPDPLGGYQSGYARQFSYKDAFCVFLGGHLVGVLRFTIPEARQILSDLESWIKKQGFFAIPVGNSNGYPEADHIYIYNLEQGKFAYAVRTIVAHHLDGTSMHTESYALTTIGASRDILDEAKIPHARVILIKTLYRLFLDAILPKNESSVEPGHPNAQL